MSINRCLMTFQQVLTTAHGHRLTVQCSVHHGTLLYDRGFRQ